MTDSLNDRDRNDALNRLIQLRAEREIGSRDMSSHRMIAYSSDAFRMALGEEHFTVTPATHDFKAPFK